MNTQLVSIENVLLVKNNNNNQLNSNRETNYEELIGKEFPSLDYLHRVQQAIEFLLKQTVTKEHIQKELEEQMKVKPSIFSHVWTTLEKENREFFVAYTMRLRIFDQIVMHEFLYTFIKEWLTKQKSVESSLGEKEELTLYKGEKVK